MGDQELMATYLSTVYQSAFSIGAHTATATLAYRDGPRVAAVLADAFGFDVLSSEGFEAGAEYLPKRGY